MTDRKHDDVHAQRSRSVEAIPWADEGADGTKYAVLEGDRDIPGTTFTYAFFIPADFWDPPHLHTTDARIVVMQGVLRLAYGNRFAPQRTDDCPAGSILFVPGHAVHYYGATEDTLIIGVATGRWRTTYLDTVHARSAGTPVARFERT